MTMVNATFLEWEKGDGDTLTTQFEINMSYIYGEDNTVQDAQVLFSGETAFHQENFPLITTQTSITIIPPVLSIPYWFKVVSLNNNNEYGIMTESLINITPQPLIVQSAILPAIAELSVEINRATKSITIK